MLCLGGENPLHFLLTLGLMVFLVGCTDSVIPQVEFEVPDGDQQLERIPPSATPEPPELMARYLELWDEIDVKRGKTGTTDSATIQEVNKTAIELAQYNGIMAEVFEAMEIGIATVGWGYIGVASRSAYVGFKANGTADNNCMHECNAKFPQLDS